MLSHLENIIKNNNRKNLVGNKISLADIHLWNMLTGFWDNNQSQIDVMITRLPNIKNLRDHIASQPKLQAWLKVRPETKA